MSQNWERLDIVIKQVFKGMRKSRMDLESCPEDHMLAAYYEGGLTSQDAESIEAHLTVCKECTDKIVLLSDSEVYCATVDDAFITEQMVQRAKNLMQPPLARVPLLEKISHRLLALRPLPTLAMASIIAVLIVSIVSLHGPGEREKIKSGVIGIVASLPSEEVTRGKEPIYRETELQEGAVLRSNDRFRIKFELSEPAYAYLLSLNSQGHLAAIFPESPASPVVKAEAGLPYLVPMDGKWFELDDNTGSERIYLLLSPTPIEGIEGKIKTLQKSGIDQIATIFPEATVQTFAFEHR